MSLCKSLAGRKRDSFVWNYFNYDDTSGKSICQVCVRDDKVCGVGITGKNTSNLVVHLQRFHKQEHVAYVQQEQSKKCVRQGTSTKRPSQSSSDNGMKTQILQSCLQRHTVSWSSDSNEHKERLRSVMNMVIDTNIPLTVMDKNYSSFRAMIKTMDSKFKLPGVYNCKNNCIK
jgi:hypothetical protein